MDWQKFRKSMDSLKPKTQGTKPTSAELAQIRKTLSELAGFGKTLSDENIEYTRSLNDYHALVCASYAPLQEADCLFPQEKGEILTFFDELVMHAMVVGNMQILDKWGIEPLMEKSVVTILGESKQTLVDFFVEKSKINNLAKKYYIHLSTEFLSRLKD